MKVKPETCRIPMYWHYI